jgi:hypothetical protein
MNSNDNNQVLKKKRTATNVKPNGLYVDYELSEEDRETSLYKDYIKIKGSVKGNKRRSYERRKYLIEQERLYVDNEEDFPEWAQKELNHLRDIKHKNYQRYQANNYAHIQMNNIKARKNKMLKDIDEGIADDPCDEAGVRIERYDKMIEICKKLDDANKNEKEQTKILQESTKKEDMKDLLDKKNKAKEEYKKMAKEQGLITTSCEEYKKRTKKPINNSQKIDLDQSRKIRFIVTKP